MKFALINPNWTFNGSIYFGCPEPHLPLEYGYAKAILEAEGHQALIIDAHLRNLSVDEIRLEAEAFGPDWTVVTTAPSYLFWRCPPPELRVPLQLIRQLLSCCGRMIAVGPHASATPVSTLKKLKTDLLIVGEFEEILPKIASGADWEQVPSILSEAHIESGKRVYPHSCDVAALAPLSWPIEAIRLHRHHHHRFDDLPQGPGAEMETSRGCPYRCSFCAKETFRGEFRKRPIETVLHELDGLIAQGIEYVYFIDEIFMPNRELLAALCERRIKFGMQSRIDLWSLEMIELLGRAGCVSIETGVESITESGRTSLHKGCRLSLSELTERLIFAKKHVSFVQANLIRTESDDPSAIEKWREHLHENGVWANRPVPLFPYPGSPLYRQRWGAPDDYAWERAHRYYLAQNTNFSDIQDQKPLSIEDLECWPCR